MDYVLTQLGTGSIQSYIFGSNSLRENIGASELVARATTEWVQDALDAKWKGAHNFSVDAESLAISYDENKSIEDGEITAEVIYAGGGNVLILFGGSEPIEASRDFVYEWSHRVIKDAPGLDVYAVHTRFNWGDSLPKAIEELVKKMAKVRNKMPSAQNSLGLSVTAICTSTELPANAAHPGENKTGFAKIANCQAIKKDEMVAASQKRLRGLFEDVDDKKLKWTDNLNIIGKLPGREDSYVAVVHADGNGMGKRIMLLNQLIDHAKLDTRSAIKAMRTLSTKLDQTAVNALVCTVNAILQEIKPEDAEEDESLIPVVKGQKYFPLRPIVFGGDDVSWVCVGPLGVSSAHRYLVELEKETLPTFAELLQPDKPSQEQIQQAQKKVDAFDPKKTKLPSSTRPYACAGVAIVKTHYPFFQAYEISEQLAKSAKDLVRSHRPDKAASAIDWHFTTTGISGELKEIRAREYELKNGRFLLARPYMLDPQYGWRTWPNFIHLWNWFDGWFDQRNKLLALREALRAGPKATAQFMRLQERKRHFPELTMPPPLTFSDGWVFEGGEAICAYFDAIELEKQYESIVMEGEAKHEPVSA